MHNGAIHAITMREGKILSSGAKDFLLKVYDGNSFQVSEQFQLGHAAKSIDILNGKILVGSRDGKILTC